MSYYDNEMRGGFWRYWVNARDGSIINRFNDIRKSDATIRGNLNSGEGGNLVSVTGNYNSYYYLYNTTRHWKIFDYPNSDTARNSTATWLTTTSGRSEMSAAYNFNLVQTYYYNIHNRNSYDNAGTRALVNVHMSGGGDNAYWDSSEQAFFFYPGETLAELTVLDVCGHEFTHAVTEKTADLVYQDEAGTLNESFSDIFGAIIEFANQPDGRSSYPDRIAGYADWLMGEDCTYPYVVAIRDMRNPQRYSAPSKYHGTYWYYGGGDNGGVHYNSGVQNHFFYLLCEGGSGNNDGISYSITGIGVENARRIAYRALTVYCTADTDYAAVRTAWISAANDLNASWGITVQAAWSAVGVETPQPDSALGEGVDASTLTWTTGGSADWFVQRLVTHDGTDAAQSGDISDNHQSWIQTMVTGPGTISFWWKVSSESGYDDLRFYIDGVKQSGSISGEVEWNQKSFSVSSGNHTLKWAYAKDYSVSSGSDCGWLDQVIWLNTTPQPPPPQPPPQPNPQPEPPSPPQPLPQPEPDIAINNFQGPVSLDNHDSLLVQISLAGSDITSYNFDYWVAADTPVGLYCYSEDSNSWYPFTCVAFQGARGSFSSDQVLNINTSILPPGNYTFYFGVDLDMNGSLDRDQLYYDYVELTISGDGGEGGISGRWEGTSSSSQVDSTLVLNQTGSSITGVLYWPNEDRTVSGSIIGNQITLNIEGGDIWNLTLSSNRNTMTGTGHKPNGRTYALHFDRH